MMTMKRLAVVLLAWLLLFTYDHERCQVQAQGCTNTCPPINFGTPVPSLCEGDVATNSDLVDVTKSYSICHPTPPILNKFQMADFIGAGRVTVLANFYVGCNAGRRESGVYAHVAQRYYNQYGERTMF